MLIIFQKYWEPKRLGVGREEGKGGERQRGGGREIKSGQREKQTPYQETTTSPMCDQQTAKMEARRQWENIFTGVRKRL